MVSAADASPITIQLVTIVGSCVLLAVYLTWFFSSQLAKNRRIFYHVISQHNREDDDRFALIDDAVWALHVRNAKRDGDMPPQRKHIPRRRYLVADGGDIEVEGEG